MNSKFLITGFPRSRTAWLANLFTCGPVFCHHDAMKNAPTAPELAYVLNMTRSLAAGDSDSALPLIGLDLDELLFEVKWIFVERPKAQALDSYIRFIEQEPYPLGRKLTFNEASKAFDILEEKLNELKEFLPDERKLVVGYKELNQLEVIKKMWCFAVGGVAFPEERWRLLDGLRINVMPSKVKINSREKLEEVCHCHY